MKSGKTSKQSTDTNRLRIRLSSFDHSLLDGAVRQLTALSVDARCDVTGPIPLPSKKIKAFRPDDTIPSVLHRRQLVLRRPTPTFMARMQELTLPSAVEVELSQMAQDTK